MFGDTSAVGTVYTTADVECSTAGKPFRVFHMSVLSGGTAAVVSLKNNGASGTVYATCKASVVSVSNEFDFGTNGILFPQGCYIDVDGNTTSVTLSGRKEL